MAASVS